MNILKNTLLGVIVAALSLPVVVSAASATIQNLSSANPLAKTSVTFSTAASGFTSPYYRVTDSFPNSSVQSSNMNFGGNFQWVPIITDIGTHNLTVTVSDSTGNTATAMQTINVLPPPSISIQSVSPGAAIMPGTTLTFSVVSPGFVNPTLSASDTFSGSSVTIGSTISSGGNFSWTPDATQNGEHTITIYAYDSQGHSAYATLPVRVGNGPTLSVPSNVNTTLSLGQQISFTATPSGFAPNSFSVSDTFAGVSTISNGNINSSGLFMWSPSGSDAGVHTVTLIGQVGSYGQSASTSVTITVRDANGALPVSVPTPASATVPTASGTTADLLRQLALLQAQVSGSSQTAVQSVGSSYIFTSYLKQGAENDEVLELQKVLQKLGHLKVAPNGYFGPSTFAAVKKFQAERGLDQLGAVGPGTRLELNSLTSTGSVTAPAMPSTSGTSYVFTHFMGIGSDDTEVILALQKKLVSLGFLKTEPTGYFGTGTEAAVKKFQAKHGLPQTGYVAKNTRAVLNLQ